ncbi:hypothetical protein [Enterovirga aerilata]|uniref:TniQ family protein n=1 Tax=Enterovirga aerilata TaxID=2730920 RepID=A0A849I445_9HYPH|nr:hypothetical protein [Enterovirga sp. DB1703]NNM74202.1 hypothetical protein [Enterovirga sp. DB1703]
MRQALSTHPLADYRLTIPGRRGMRIVPLPFRLIPGPIAGESLLGLAARAAHHNGFESLHRVFRLADVHNLRTEAFPTTQIERAAHLAYVLKMHEGEITSRMHPGVPRPGRSAGFIDFGSVAIRAAYREGGRRRVSPLSLRRSPHHRSVWSLLPFAICPESREHLIDACPVCTKPLRWRRTLGIPFCESCVDDDGDPTVDLRDHAGPVAHIADEDAFRLMTGIVDPDPDRRRTERRKLPDAIARLDDGDIFEFAVALACAVTTEPDAPRGIMRRMKTLADFARITPDALAKAGRTLIDWPRGFHALADETRAAADLRAGHYGVRKELGPLLMLTRDGHLAPEAKELVRKEIDANMAVSAAAGLIRRRDNHREDEWITAQDAARRFGITRKLMGRLARHPDIEVRRASSAVRSPLLFRASAVEMVAKLRKDAVASQEAANLLGIPRSCLPDLVARGLLRLVAGPVTVTMAGQEHYVRSELLKLIQGIKERAQEGSTDGTSIRLSKAMKRLGGSPPWGAVLTGILEGAIPILTVPGQNGCLATAVAVHGMQGLARVAREAGVIPNANAPGDARISHKEAAALIGTTEPFMSGLVAAGLLPRSDHGYCRLQRADVEAFRAEYVLVNELARCLGIRHRDVRRTLTASGSEPVASVTAHGGFVWRRAELPFRTSRPRKPTGRRTATCSGVAKRPPAARTDRR